MSRQNVLHLYYDTGPPEGSADYTTLVLFHGWGWHSMIWERLLPLAPSNNVRMVLVNRRDYPGSAPYTDRDRGLLQSALDEKDAAAALEQLLTFMQERAREVYDFLVDFVKDNSIPCARTEANAGGIVVVGWSLGSAWMTAFLANVVSFPVGDVKLSDYVRRVILHDPGYHTLGYSPPSPPADPWNPFMDTSLSPEESASAFATWVSGYYSHGESPASLEFRRPDASPPPTVSTMTPEELASVTPSECDTMLHHACLRWGAFGHLRKDMVFLERGGRLEGESGSADPEKPQEGTGDEWWAVEVRHVLCERSVWEVCWGMWALRAELEEARLVDRRVRKVTFLTIKGANHFSPWDLPEETLRAFLAPESVSVVA